LSNPPSSGRSLYVASDNPHWDSKAMALSRPSEIIR
jgi:hypothetical protein